MDIVNLTEKIRRYALTAVSKERYEHSLRFAETASRICRLTGQDYGLGYMAGVAHDMCKGMSPELLLSFASRDGREITGIERDNPVLLHGRAAAVKLQEDFGVLQPEVLQAVGNHVFGSPFLCPLAKIVFVADKVEPGRSYVTDEYLGRLFALTLNQMARQVVSENKSFLEQKGKVPHPLTLQFLAELEADIAAGRSGQ